MENISSFGFELKFDGSLTEFPGLKVEQTTGSSSIIFKQPSLMVKVINSTSLYSAITISAPIIQLELGSDEDGAGFNESWSHRTVMSMLLCLAMNTRPDISYAVSNVTCFRHNPIFP